MDAGLLALFIICCVALLSFLGVARVVNALAGKPLVNGAALFFWLLLAAIVGLFGYQWTLPRVTERMAYYAGQSLATVLPVLAISFYLGRRFRLRHGGRPVGEAGPRA